MTHWSDNPTILKGGRSGSTGREASSFSQNVQLLNAIALSDAQEEIP